MKGIFVIILSASVFLSASLAFRAAAQETKPAKSKSTFYLPSTAGTDGQEVFDYITKDNPYKKWKLWPGKGKLYAGTQPHGALLTTYVNKIALRSIKAKKGMKTGSMIVKENYAADKKLVALTMMYREDGFNPEGGDWYWLKSTPDGKIEAWGKVDACIQCHVKNKENDYIFSGEVVKGKFKKE